MQNVKKIWFNLSNKVRFFIIGGFNAGVSYGFYVLFCLILGNSNYQAALVLSWIFSSIISFTTQKYLVFQSEGNWYKEYLRCCLTWSLSYVLNALFLEISVKVLGMNVFAAQILSTFSVAVFTYVLFKKFAFKVSS
ncbi:GtrA family protein [bacterium]|nr:GtrA family protein [bacterium]